MAFKIYTKTGDLGQTGLIGGTRVAKDNKQIEAYGTVDELNAHLGLIRDHLEEPLFKEQLLLIQDRLFVIGSMLAVDTAKRSQQNIPQLEEENIFFLEKAIDIMEAELPALKSFVLPGGNRKSSLIHVARTVCRRAERNCVSLSEEPILGLSDVIKYLNRLSDYLFVLARYILNKNGGKDIAWIAQKGT